MKKARKYRTQKTKRHPFFKAAQVCVMCAALAGTSVFASAMTNQTLSADSSETIPELSEGKMVISEAGTYTLKGNMTGTVYVDPGVGDVTLILDNVNIAGGETGGITVVSGDSLNIQTAEGSINTITDNGITNAYGAAVFSDVNVTFSGEGTLNILGSQGQGVCTQNADITFDGGEYWITSTGNGLSAEGENPGRIVLNSGVIYVDAKNNAVNPDSALIKNGGELHDLNSESTTAQTAVSSAVSSSESSQSVISDTLPEAGSLEESSKNILPEELPALPSDADAQASADGQTTPPALPSDADAQAQADGQTTPPALPTDADAQAQADGQMTPPSFPGRPGSQSATTDSETTTTDGEAAATDGQTAPQQPTFPGNQGMNGQMPGMNTSTTTTGSTDTAGEVVTSDVENSAASLEADYDNATTVTVTDEDSQVSISESGTYVVTGSSSNGNITVEKGTTGVVLVLEDLDLTSMTGATLSVNKNAEVQIVVSGEVTLTDAEDPADEESTDAEVADAFDGAAIKIKANSVVCITGDGTLNLNGDAKNGIKAGDESSLVIDGDVTLNITAANDGINSNYDVTILDGDITINAADDAVHADHILTIGDEEDGTGPDLTVESSTEGLEGTVVNIFGGNVDVTSSDDGINAANGDAVYEGVLDYSFNMTGGDLNVQAGGDAVDSNGNVNLIGGSATLQASNGAGEAGIDYDGEFYISEDFQLNNNSGVSGADMMMGGMNQGNMNQGNMNQGNINQGNMNQGSMPQGGPSFGGMN